MNALAFELLRRVEDPGQKNVLVSPLSIGMALSLLLPGLNDRDKEAVARCIAPNVASDRAFELYGELGRQILGASNHESCEVRIGNSAWIEDGNSFEHDYETALQRVGAECYKFRHDHESVSRINAWVKDRTKDRIPSILDSIGDDENLFLINAIAFDGRWETKFDPARTLERPFYVTRHRAVTRPMMYAKRPVPYAHVAYCRCIRLQYSGSLFSMILFLPEQNESPLKLLHWMREKELSKLQLTLKYSHHDAVEILLPKFKFEDQYELSRMLTSMGLGNVFKRTDFSRLSRGLGAGSVSQIRHKTFIDVDEAGTKAAAATIVQGMRMASMEPSEPPRFIADRPFGFFIMHNESDAILFAGVVNQP